MIDYNYTECGLNNVFIEGMNVVENHAGELTNTISAVGLLHRVIAERIVTMPSKMSGNELRFLRTEMGLTQEQLAEILKIKLLAVSRWEREKTRINDTAEMLIRLLAVHRLKLKADVDDVSGWVNLSSQSGKIRIDGSDPNRYQLMAA